MSATKSRKRRRGAAEEHGDGERWLLTYADMITLLMALFMVLFSISSVNTSKYESLQRALEDAFSGRILPGGKGTTQAGGAESTPKRPSQEAPIPAIRPIESLSQDQKAQIKREDENFRRLKAQVDSYAKQHGLESQIETTVTQRGLVIRVMTDKLLFDSGEAAVKEQGQALIRKVGGLLTADAHSISVEGHTDSVPIETAQYPSNWELSTARSSAVLRELVADGVSESRFEAAGYSDLYPIDSNMTIKGRARNRRVEIVLLRKAFGRQKGPVTP